MPVLHLDTSAFFTLFCDSNPFGLDGKLGGTPAAVFLCTLRSPGLKGAKSWTHLCITVWKTFKAEHLDKILSGCQVTFGTKHYIKYILSFSFQALPRIQVLSISVYLLRSRGSGWGQGGGFCWVRDLHCVLCTGFWNSSKSPFILGEIPLGRLDLGWSLERDQALSLWSGSTDSKTLDNQRTNPR